MLILFLFFPVLQLQNAQQAALEKNDTAAATKDELETTKLRVETLSSQLQQYQKDVSAVHNKTPRHHRPPLRFVQQLNTSGVVFAISAG